MMCNVELIILFLVVGAPVCPILIGMVPSIILEAVPRDIRAQRCGIAVYRTRVNGGVGIIFFVRRVNGDVVCWCWSPRCLYGLCCVRNVVWRSCFVLYW